ETGPGGLNPSPKAHSDPNAPPGLYWLIENRRNRKVLLFKKSLEGAGNPGARPLSNAAPRRNQVRHKGAPRRVRWRAMNPRVVHPYLKQECGIISQGFAARAAGSRGSGKL